VWDGKPIENVRLADLFRDDLALAGIVKETDPELFPERDELRFRRARLPL
jgi:hypothetical protein